MKQIFTSLTLKKLWVFIFLTTFSFNQISSEIKELIINSSFILNNNSKTISKTFEEHKNIKLTLASNIEDSSNGIDFIKNLINEIKKVKDITIDIDASRLTIKNHKPILTIIASNINYFNEVSFGFLDEEEGNEEDNIEFILMDIINKFYSQTSQNASVKDGKLYTSFFCINRYNKTLKVKLSKKYKIDDKNHNPFNVITTSNPLEINKIHKKNKGNNNELKEMEKRKNKFLESDEINYRIKERIKELWKIVGKGDANPNNAGEFDKAYKALDYILYSFIFDEEQDRNKNIITNKFKNALKDNNIKEYQKLQNNIMDQIFIKDINNLTNEDNYKLYKSINASKIIGSLMGDIKHLSDPHQIHHRISKLLCGAPGTGKTKCIQVLAKLCNIPCVILNADQEKTFFDGIGYSYVGSRPGAIIRALKESFAGKERLMKNEASKVGILIIDEVDKLCPEAMDVLLKFLDSSQQGEDKNLNIPIPMDTVIVYCTANDINKLSQPLRDRLQVIQMEPMDDDEKVGIMLHSIYMPLLKRFPGRKIIMKPEAIQFLTSSIPHADGVRQASQYASTVSSEIIEHYLNEDDKKPIEITIPLISQSLDKIHKVMANIFPNESLVGSINGVVLAKKGQRNGPEDLYLKNSNIVISAGSSYNGDHVILPADNFTHYLSKAISRIVDNVLRSFHHSNKNVVIDIKDHDIFPEGHRSLSALVAIAWCSAVMDRKVKPNSTIIADLLPDQRLEYTKDTITRIKLAYNAGLKNIVIGTINNGQKDIEQSSEFKYLMKEFHLKPHPQQSNDKNYFTYIAINPKKSYGDIQIHIIKDLKTAIDVLLIEKL